MQNNYNESRVQKIFEILKQIEATEKVDLEVDLENLKEICRIYYNLVDGKYGENAGAYENYIVRKNLEFPVLYKFIWAVKNVSKEAYEYMMEGHDLLNIRRYLMLYEGNESAIIAKAAQVYEFCECFEHSILKLINETDETKKLLMLRGLIGM